LGLLTMNSGAPMIGSGERARAAGNGIRRLPVRGR
jgi:hypothetical protein